MGRKDVSIEKIRMYVYMYVSIYIYTCMYEFKLPVSSKSSTGSL